MSSRVAAEYRMRVTSDWNMMTALFCRESPFPRNQKRSAFDD